MPERDAAILLEDIRAAMARINRYTIGLDRETFLADEKTVDAVVRNLEIIGEAARRLPDQFKQAHLEIPWPQIAGLRNRIVHDYFGLDLHLIWHILHADLKDLEMRLTDVS